MCVWLRVYGDYKMQKAFSSSFSKAFNQSYGDEFSPYAILDENLNAIYDLLGNVIEEEF